MFQITKQFDFEAAHRLDHMPAGHPCKNLHGHSYRVVVVIGSRVLDSRGFCAIDYRDLEPFKDYLNSTFDHKFLNDVLDFPTTAENLALYLYNRVATFVPAVVEVRVSETAKTWAIFRGVS
jgi:6-pyruvoyltetrahydropterin/6-carboxytetrahydropterin synthase